MANSTGRSTIIVSANSLWNLVNFRSRLIEALQYAGYEVIAAAPAAEETSQTVPAGVRIEQVPMRSDGLNPVQDLRTFIAYTALFRRVRPHAVLSFTAKPNIYGALAAAVSGARAVPNVSGLGTAFIRGGALQRLLSQLYRVAFRRSPIVFFQNGEDRDLFVRESIVRPEQAYVLPGSGVDLQRFRPVPRDERPAGESVFLYVGRLLGDKGVREFAKAAQIVKTKHPEARFQLLGFSNAENRTAISAEELAEWCRDGIVEYLGSAQDVRPFLAAADAVVLPSYREGLPRSLLEAAAMGRPLIATDVPGNREVVLPGVNGLLCEVRSAESLAAACEAFMNLPEQDRRRLGEASRSMVEERFSEERVITAYLDAVRIATEQNGA